MEIKVGDIVGRKSYGEDIFFIVNRIIYKNARYKIAILKGVIQRIEADSPISDLIKIDISKIKEIEERIENRYVKNVIIENAKDKMCTGRILHLDGDKRYSEKSIRYYKKLGLKAIVRHIPENKQPKTVRIFLEKYVPDVLVVTGHDAMLKSGSNFNDLYNYRNSRHFIETVKEARRWRYSSDNLVIFARCMPKFF